MVPEYQVARLGGPPPAGPWSGVGGGFLPGLRVGGRRHANEEGGRREAIAYFAELRAAFPDFSLQITDLIAQDDLAAVHWRATGTFAGSQPYQGIEPNGARLQVQGVDFLRVRDLRLWDKDSKEACFVRRLGARPHPTYEDYREFCETRPPEVVANIAVCLIHLTNYLLDRQIRRLEQDFLKEGGIRERMTRARLQHRNTANRRHPPPPGARERTP